MGEDDPGAGFTSGLRSSKIAHRIRLRCPLEDRGGLNLEQKSHIQWMDGDMYINPIFLVLAMIPSLVPRSATK